MKQTVTQIIQNIQRGHTYKQWTITILVNITTLSFGLQNSWPACVSKLLQSDESPTGSPLSTLDISWVASSPSLAAMLSIPVWTFAVDKYGRKPCLIIFAVFHVISWLIIYIATNLTTILIARVLIGAASGGCVYSMPMYIKEISQDDLRGILGLIMNTSRNIGVLLIFILGAYFDYYTILYIAITISVVGLLAVLKTPESPTYYVKIGQIESAAATIAYLRNFNVDDKDVKKAINSIKAEDEKFKSIPNITFFKIFKQKAWCKGFCFMVLLMLCHGLNGCFTVLNYAPTMLNMAGVVVNPELQSLSVPVFMIIGSLLSMVLIERLGRKPILVTSFVLALLAFAVLTGIIIIQQGGRKFPDWISVVATAVPVFSYAAAISPLPFVIMAEMFNFQIRAKLMGILGMLGWAGAFIQTLIFEPISSAFGPPVTFIYYSLFNLFGTFIVLVLFPETKGKSVEEIELELERKLER